MAQNCKRVEKVIKAKDSRTGKKITFMSKPKGCGKPKYDQPSKRQLEVRKAIISIGKTCAGVGNMGPGLGRNGRGGMDAEKKACVRSAAKFVFTE